jgi:hypothetical protein
MPLDTKTVEPKWVQDEKAGSWTCPTGTFKAFEEHPGIDWAVNYLHGEPPLCFTLSGSDFLALVSQPYRAARLYRLEGWAFMPRIDYDRKYRSKNPDKVKRWRKISQVRARKARQSYVLGYLRAHPCIDCGEPDPVVLEFDHIRGEKIRPINQMIVSSSSKQLTQEIEKCEVRCANCHRRRHAKEIGSYRYSCEK